MVIRMLRKTKSSSWVSLLLAAGMLLVFTSCSNELGKGKKAYNKRNYDEAIAHFNQAGGEEGKAWAQSADFAKQIESELMAGVQAKRTGNLDEAVNHFQKAVELEGKIPHLSKYLKTRMGGIKIELTQTVVEQLRKAKQEKRYETILKMKPHVGDYITEGDRYFQEVQDIITFAEGEIRVMKKEEAKGDKLLESGDEKGAIEAWRMAMKHASVEHGKRISQKLYDLQNKVEGGIRGEFDSAIDSSRTALESGKYNQALESANAAIEVTQRNPDITLDAGLAYRYKRLAEENLREQELAAAKAQAEADRKKAIEEYIRIHGQPMTPTVIDYSKDNKITAKGKGRIKKNERGRWYATALIDEGAYRKLYVRVPEGYEAIVTRSPDKQEKANDVVTKTFIDQGYIYFIAENFTGGRFYIVVTNPEGKKGDYEVDATLYHELDK
ncbi:MAG: hypothetical protein V2A56_11360 [bacterium]